MKPIQLFIIANVIYFLYLHFNDASTFTSSLKTQYNSQAYSNWIKPIIDAKLNTLQISFADYAKIFDPAVKGLAKTLVFLMIPLFALGLSIVYIFRKLYFVEHLVFATHFFSFLLILASLGPVIIIYPYAFILILINGKFSEGPSSELFISLALGAIAGTYLFIALRKVYRETPVVTFFKTAVTIFSLMFILQFYRLILFFIAFYTLRIH